MADEEMKEEKQEDERDEKNSKAMDKSRRRK